MSRPWDTHTRTALGAKAHTIHKDRGPSKSWTVVNLLKTSSANWRQSMDARLVIGIQSVGTSNYTGGICFIDIGSCGASPTVNFSHSETGIRSFTVETPYVDVFPDLMDTEHDPSTSGLWTYKDETGSPRCYGYYRQATNPDFGFNLRIPLDSTDTVLYFAATVFASPEADRLTGIPSCASGWSVAPPADLVYRPAAVSATNCYQVYKRAAEGAAWVPVDVPWDLWPNLALYGLYRLNQTTGTIWAKTGASEIKVWPIETSYNAATKTTITIPAGNVTFIAAWGRFSFVGSSNGNIYVYEETTSLGAVGSPLNPATWDWSHVGHGWLTVTDGDTVHFWKIEETGMPTFFQSLTGEAGMFSNIETVSDSCAVSGDYDRLLLDHATGEWFYAGVAAHALELANDGWERFDTTLRHTVMFRENEADSARWDYRYVQFI